VRGLRISDHALLRWLQRAGGLDVEAVRSALAGSLCRAHAAAQHVGACDYSIHVDGVTFVVRSGTVTTVLPEKAAAPASEAGR
jgi:hypothetical protein